MLSIDPETRQSLSLYGFDEATFTSLRENVRDGRLSAATNLETGRIEAPLDDDLSNYPGIGSPEWTDAHRAGSEAIAAGQFAMAVLNGGMATRFGGVVKGTVTALDDKSFIEWKLESALELGNHFGGHVPVALMNSFATDAATRAFIENLRTTRTALPEPRHFNQGISLRLRPDGDLFTDDNGHPSPYAPGHGDFHGALHTSGLLADLRNSGIRYISLSNVDNLGARPDPVLLGMHILSSNSMTVEVAESLGDVGGAPARIDGRLAILEGFRIPPSFDTPLPVFNTNSFIFDLDALEADHPLTWFYVEKTIDDRTAIQLERLVGELSSFLDSNYVVIPRSGPRGRFFPIKTPEDLEASQQELREMLGTSLLG